MLWGLSIQHLVELSNYTIQEISTFCKLFGYKIPFREYSSTMKLSLIRLALKAGMQLDLANLSLFGHPGSQSEVAGGAFGNKGPVISAFM